MRRLLCIFPFEEEFFRREGVNATYIGHPLAGLVRPSLTRDAIVPPERNFPLTVVLLHGILAVTTLVLVLFTAIGNIRR